MDDNALGTIVDAIVTATNAFDIERALALFSASAVIEDPSTGERFEGHIGVRDYIERFFVGYHTVTRMLSTRITAEDRILARVDFTGDFGHEIGRLHITLDTNGLIARIDADLE